jgi:hypothetical protein
MPDNVKYFIVIPRKLPQPGHELQQLKWKGKVMANRFVVDLSGVKLSKEMSRNLEANIQQAVLKSISDLRIQPDIALRFPKEWLGIILNPDFGRLSEIEAEIGQQMR